MRCVALLRGINVGGRTRLPMADLRVLLADLGHENVVTYLQSGNAVFEAGQNDADAIGRDIEAGITERLGLDVRVMIRTGEEMAAISAANPFAVEAARNPKTVHVSFLAAHPDSERLATIDPQQFAPDEFRLGDRAVYLHLAGGYHVSKITNDFWERRLGLPATTRNWNTVSKLADLCRD